MVSASAAAEHVVTSAIILNLPIAAWPELSHDELAEHLDMGLLVFFAAEILVRLVYACKRRRFDLGLAFDTLIVVLALSGLPVARAARLGHLSRRCAHLRHVVVARGVTLTRARQLARII